MYLIDDMDIGIVELCNISKETDNGNCKKTQNVNIKIYTRATYMILKEEYKKVYD